MQQLSNKLQKLHQGIRKQQIASIMKKARYQTQRLQHQTLLNDIINLQPEHYTSDHMQTLIEMVNKDLTNAILHLGNLVIDRFITVQVLEGVEWRVGNNQKWTWLINAFSEIGFCTTEMFEHCIRRIISKRSNFNLENALEVLQKSFKLNELSFAYFKEAGLVLAISNHIYDTSDRISLVALTIFTTVTSEDETIPMHMYTSLGEERLTQLLMHCFMKVQSIYRALACQIANNFLMSEISLQTVRIRILELALAQKEKVKLQISYYLKGFSEKAPEDVILGYIKRYRLLQILQKYSKISSNNPKYDQEISQNAVKSLNTIFQRFNSSTQLQFFQEKQRQNLMQRVEKMLDDSQSQTLYQQESRVMQQ